MAYTQTDLDDLEAAIKQKITGKRVRSRDTAGKTTEFADCSLSDMYKLRDIMISDIQAASNTGGCFNKVRFDNPT